MSTRPTTHPLRPLPAGPRGILIDCGTTAVARACYRSLQARRMSGLLEAADLVPGATTVLVDGIDEPELLAAELPGWPISVEPEVAGETVEIPVCYDGPDLETVAKAWGVSAEEVADIHSSVEYEAAFCGFSPGFAYLEGLPEEFHVPRRDEPRTSVPAGSVAIAGPYTGVYPRSSPGGWQLIATMTNPGRLWNEHREPAALLVPGTKVRFAAVRV
ncbi:5-oxoprolinase subunit PxpB [Glycomyces luteolus]|uniref:5-oxoprolinase subunit PxpB n=1 Tax=Glycomyces luteolus TaxID=2670330 RepID=A0A9X3ST11_9ACTN|nr:5-oxoprolinase subunit PxpB [Glycomyces luteolus]MDA1361754.1 5-oxoprolinase subunit PxpB [Glycomyces luteolus]